MVEMELRRAKAHPRRFRSPGRMTAPPDKGYGEVKLTEGS